MILTKNNISYFIINHILLKKNNYKILLEIQDDYIEPKLTNIFKYIKSKDILGKDFEIELYGIEHNKAELVNNILKIENNYEARYLKDYLLTTQREKVLNEISTLITKDVSIDEKKVLIEKSLKPSFETLKIEYFAKPGIYFISDAHIEDAIDNVKSVFFNKFFILYYSLILNYIIFLSPLKIFNKI